MCVCMPVSVYVHTRVHESGVRIRQITLIDLSPVFMVICGFSDSIF